MGKRSRKKREGDTPSSSTSPSTSDDSDSWSRRRRRHRKERQRGDESSRREREREREKRKKRELEKERSRRKLIREEKRKRDHSSSDDLSGSDSVPERSRMVPEEVVHNMLSEFANVGTDLKQLLQMIDDGQAVDIGGISERSLCKRLRMLFVSLNLKESGDGVFVRQVNAPPVLFGCCWIHHSCSYGFKRAASRFFCVSGLSTFRIIRG